MTARLVNCLVEALNNNGVVYCHWKSNFFLTEAMSGETDIDFLVDHKSLSQMLTILSSFGFKPAIEKGVPETPGISHLYGFDPGSGQLIHVHLFSRVLTGESLVKSHLLPFQQMLLENTTTMGQIKVPSESAELVSFTVRTFIKYGSLLDLIYLSRASDEIRAELHWLLAGSEMAEVLSLLAEYCPVIDEPLFIECIRSLDSSTSLVRRIMVARQVRRCLRRYAIYGCIGRNLAYGRVLWREAWRRLLGNRRNRVLDSGGKVIAFVGAEATGKSTLVSDCGQWLGDVFAVRKIHAGKPPSSWLTMPYNMFLPLARRVFPQLRTTRIEGTNASKKSPNSKPSPGGISSLLVALGAVVLAWDRRQLLVKARRLAAKEEIIICDRYPSDTIGAMDSPRLKDIPIRNGAMAAIYNLLVRIERQLYKQIPAPDMVLQLEVSVETAVKRNRDRKKAGKESDTYVVSRHRQFRHWNKPGTNHIYRLDTSQPLQQTVLEARNAIWEML